MLYKGTVCATISTSMYRVRWMGFVLQYTPIQLKLRSRWLPCTGVCCNESMALMSVVLMLESCLVAPYTLKCHTVCVLENVGKWRRWYHSVGPAVTTQKQKLAWMHSTVVLSQYVHFLTITLSKQVCIGYASKFHFALTCTHMLWTMT